MALRDQPYIPLYVQDFMTDEKLAECSASATGVFIRIMCLMHKSEPYGMILLKQKHKQTGDQIKDFASQLGKHLPYDTHTILLALIELVDEKVLKIDGDFLIQKRMVRDNEISEKRALAGRSGGKQSQSKHKNFAQAKTQANPENEIEYENESESGKKGGVGENLMNGTQLVPTLCRKWYARFPTYSQDQQLDFQAVGKIVSFLSRQYSVRDVTDPETVYKICEVIDQIADQVTAQPFWINKPLSSIANSIQEFFNKINNPQHAKPKPNLADNSRPGRQRTAL